jgi:hypothetical protein
MIVREILKDPLTGIGRFDFFNDYKDTRSWLVGGGHEDLAALLDSANKIWLKSRFPVELDKPDTIDKRYLISIDRNSKGWAVFENEFELVKPFERYDDEALALAEAKAWVAQRTIVEPTLVFIQNFQVTF